MPLDKCYQINLPLFFVIDSLFSSRHCPIYLAVPATDIFSSKPRLLLFSSSSSSQIEYLFGRFVPSSVRLFLNGKRANGLGKLSSSSSVALLGKGGVQDHTAERQNNFDAVYVKGTWWNLYMWINLIGERFQDTRVIKGKLQQ